MRLEDYKPSREPDASMGGRPATAFNFEGMPKVVGVSRRALAESRDTASPHNEKRTKAESRDTASPHNEQRTNSTFSNGDPGDMHNWPESSF